MTDLHQQAISAVNFAKPSPITLAVGWTVGRNTKVRQVLLGSSVADEFRSVVQRTIQDLGDRESADWTPEADLSPETFLVIDASEVGDAPRLTSDHDGKRFLEVLAQAERLEAINPRHLPTGDVSFYAIVVGAPGDRSVFIRRSNPRRGLKRGRIYSTLSDTLQTVDDPIFAFDEWVDLAVIRSNVYILSQTVFAAFFRDQETLAQKIPEWIDQLATHVSLAEESKESFSQRVVKDSRLKARLEAIVRRDHLSSVSTETLRTAMEGNEMDPSRFLDAAGNLVVAADDVPQILYLLNEDLFTGSLTKTGFRADKKAAR
ncbi:hypothetical protein [Mycolicibacterium lutetiense]|uniref:DUF4868 domain-containing protein n=1 Tax=Mycolicibacterium lutetiense TaxID=1641992 RepID=A0ABS4ZVF4_9MYCO|nr:hypothetical protein [Mycolicibacterium lutetiense]MBP2453479.1 hypothetical protein [Mycolicibacterium lutetiense]